MSLVNTWSRQSYASVSSATFTVTGTRSAGNTFFLTISWQASGNNVASPTSVTLGGVAMTLAAEAKFNDGFSNTNCTAVYYLHNAASGTNTNAVVTFSTGGSYASIACSEHSGLNNAAPSLTTSQTGDVDPIACASGTLPSASELVFFLGVNAKGTSQTWPAPTGGGYTWAFDVNILDWNNATSGFAARTYATATTGFTATAGTAGGVHNGISRIVSFAVSASGQSLTLGAPSRIRRALPAPTLANGSPQSLALAAPSRIRRALPSATLAGAGLNFVCVGNSLVAGIKDTGGVSDYRLAGPLGLPQDFPSATFSEYISGTTQAAFDNYAAQIRTLFVAGKTNILLFFESHNNLESTHNVSAEISLLNSISTLAKADGFKVVFANALPLDEVADLSTPLESQYLRDLNTRIPSEGTADLVIDLRNLVPEFGINPGASNPLFSGPVHLSDLGYAKMSRQGFAPPLLTWVGSWVRPAITYRLRSIHARKLAAPTLAAGSQQSVTLGAPARIRRGLSSATLANGSPLSVTLSAPLRALRVLPVATLASSGNSVTLGAPSRAGRVLSAPTLTPGTPLSVTLSAPARVRRSLSAATLALGSAQSLALGAPTRATRSLPAATLSGSGGTITLDTPLRALRRLPAPTLALGSPQSATLAAPLRALRTVPAAALALGSQQSLALSAPARIRRTVSAPTLAPGTPLSLTLGAPLRARRELPAPTITTGAVLILSAPTRALRVIPGPSFAGGAPLTLTLTAPTRILRVLPAPGASLGTTQSLTLGTPSRELRRLPAATVGSSFAPPVVIRAIHTRATLIRTSKIMAKVQGRIGQPLNMGPIQLIGGAPFPGDCYVRLRVGEFGAGHVAEYSSANPPALPAVLTFDRATGAVVGIVATADVALLGPGQHAWQLDVLDSSGPRSTDPLSTAGYLMISDQIA